MTATIRPIEARDHDEWRALFTAYGVFYAVLGRLNHVTFATPLRD